MRHAWTLLIACVLLVLAGCEESRPPLVVGAKTFAESRILGEIFARAAEEAGIPVARRIPFGSTRVNLEGLKRGSIDIYPEYNGTGLVMVGQPPISDGDESFARVRELFDPLGLTWAPALGFSNDYTLVMRPGQASNLGIETISDLARDAGALTIGIEDDFLTRPLDGFEALQSRYGMEFGETEIVPIANRRELYEMLLDGRVDVIEVYATDGQLADFNLRAIEDDLEFFPVYEAAPLVRQEALERHPELQGVLAELEGKLDVALMRDLNNRVELLGEDPADVARSALIRIGIIEGVARAAAEQPLVLAVTPSAVADGEMVTAMRAVRQAFPGRNVEISPSPDPFAQIDSGEARLALVGASAFFEDGENGAATPRPGFEAVGVVGQTYLHVLSLDEDVPSLSDAETIATGPEGSGSHRVALTLVEGMGLDAEIRPFRGEDARALAEAIAGSDAGAAVIVQPIGNDTVVTLMAGGATLLPVESWNTGNNLIRYPFLRPARIPANTYSGQTGPTETLSTQLVLAGPAETEELSVGDQGPGASFIPRARPLTGDTVRALATALPGVEGIDPVLPQSAALSPELPSPPASINPSFGISILSLAVIAMLTWMGWLLVRPARR